MTGTARYHRDWIIPILGLLLELAFVVLLVFTGLNRSSPWLEVFFFLPFSIYLLAVWYIGKMKTGPATPQTVAVILLFAVVFEATLLLSPLPLSNDIYRYYWDGKTTDNGFNPYAYSPDANALALLRDSDWQQVMNKNVHTMYPPLAQLVFAVAFRIAPTILTWRLFSALFHLLSIPILVRILKELCLDVRYSIIYAWSPLALIEFANSGHIDSLAVLLTGLSFLALLRKRTALSAAALALAFLTKIFPLLFAGLFFLPWGKKGTAIFTTIIAAFYLPFAGAGAGLWQGSLYFVDRGIFNGSLFPLLAGLLEQFLWPPDALHWAKLFVLVVFACLFAYLFLRALLEKANDLTLFKYSFWLTAVFLLMTPTIHPWYLTWVLPFLVVFPSTGWILLTGTSVLARTVYISFDATGVWRELSWVPLAEYLPFYVLLAWSPVRRLSAWISDGTTRAESKASLG
ncbi:MAG: glycosyltransferase 87 family protein [Chloroflexi bacterium]|nr:glycosyltransferase 87 family protein [Chloroflexota bacterium]